MTRRLHAAPIKTSSAERGQLRAQSAAEGFDPAVEKLLRCSAQRLHTLEDEVKKKSDTGQTQNMVALAQRRERLRQLREANDADQQAIFDTQNDTGSASDPDAGRKVMFDIGKIQIRMVRRNSEQKMLREEISDLETKLGIPSQNADSGSK